MADIHGRRLHDRILVLFFLAVSIGLYFLPTGFENRVDTQAVRCRGRILSSDDSQVQQMGIVKVGQQAVNLKLLDGPFKGQTVEAVNQLYGKMEIDKFFVPGDVARVVLTIGENGQIIFANPQDHDRLRLELLLFGLFAALLLIYGGFTGAKALLSFVFAGLLIWKVLTPYLLRGYNPVLLALAIVFILCGAIIFLVGGPTRKGLVAFLGAFAGVATAGVLALVFTGAFHVHGAVKPFAETLLYSGYPNLNMRLIFVAAVILGCSGAVMDLAMDVAASLDEIARKVPDLSRREAALSGLRVGRAVVGTMTTTLLLAYSGGYISLLMVFMAQGVPVDSLLNLIYVAADLLNTLVGSFGLVTVAPFTAIIGALFYGGRHITRKDKPMTSQDGLKDRGSLPGPSIVRNYTINAADCPLRAGDQVSPGTLIGHDPEDGKPVASDIRGIVRAVAFDSDRHALVVTIESAGEPVKADAPTIPHHVQVDAATCPVKVGDPVSPGTLLGRQVDGSGDALAQTNGVVRAVHFDPGTHTLTVTIAETA